MAVSVSLPRMNGNGVKPLHPFFAKPLKDVQHQTPRSITPANELSEPSGSDNSANPSNTVGHAPLNPPSKETSALLVDKPASGRSSEQPEEAISLETDPNQSRRKRAKVGHTKAGLEQNQHDDSPEKTVLPATSQRHTVAVVVHVGKPQHAEDTDATNQPPRKLLKLNSSGTLGSLPKLSKEPVEAKAIVTKKKISPKSAAKEAPPSTDGGSTYRGSRIIVLKYKHLRIRSEIEAIFSKDLSQLKGAGNTSDAKPKEKEKPKAPPKTTHPFFLKPPKEIEHKSDSRPHAPAADCNIADLVSVSCATADHQPKAQIIPSWSTFTRTLPKQQSSKDAPWPWKGVSHVRDSPSINVSPSSESATSTGILSRKKNKQVAVKILDEENVLSNFMRARWNSPLASYAENSEHKPKRQERAQEAGTVRILPRLIMSGYDLQREALSTMQSNALQNDQGGCLSKVHSAIQALTSRLRGYLSPFDRNRCETRTWLQKYAPSHADEVLQDGMEAKVLRDWLVSMKVNNVDSGKPRKPAEKDEKDKHKLKKKRKRKNDMDDFIVDEDDIEQHDDDDWTDLDEDPHNGTNRRPSNYRSIVRKANKESKGGHDRLANAVLLTGPNGCGKTAAVYAVAKELGFEVFEINSGSRRSGKDILDRIGDMAENHLVQQVSNAIRGSESAKAGNIASASITTNAEEGRQGNVTSFFKPMASKDVSKPHEARPTAEQKNNIAPSKQKQSLILLEEVDVLFSEDKQFWSTVLALVMHSKRPIVLTCNDENMVPTNALALHALLRFAPPSATTVCDYLRLIAACEGHIIDNDTLYNLYDVTGNNLRASITTLQFWCQMGIGSQKGGLDWMIDRYPIGIDLDGAGNTVRAISNKTYQSGMETLNRDILNTDEQNANDVQLEDTLATTIRDLNVTLENFVITPSDLLYGGEPDGVPLEVFEDTASHLSSLDVLCGGDMRTGLKTNLDATHPVPSDKQKRDYTAGSPYILSERIPDFHRLDAEMTATSLTLMRRMIGNARAHGGHADRDTTRFCLDTIRSSTALQSWGTKTQLQRSDFSLALDTLAEDDSFYQDYCTMSSFDREFNVVTQDVAPHVRAIAHHDVILEHERAAQLLHGLKRSRTSRVSRSAAEGGRREEKRKERWFSKDLNLQLVMGTGSAAWYDPQASPLAPLSSNPSNLAGYHGKLRSGRYLSDMYRCW